MLRGPSVTVEGLRDKIAAMWPNGWWKRSSEETFQRLATLLLAHGFAPEGAFDLLDAARSAIADEYGD
jgi:hypothetical protein